MIKEKYTFSDSDLAAIALTGEFALKAINHAPKIQDFYEWHEAFKAIQLTILLDQPGTVIETS